jgi:hypothetical protein
MAPEAPLLLDTEGTDAPKRANGTAAEYELEEQ